MAKQQPSPLSNPYEVFTPGAPVRNRELFKGRVNQIQRIMEAIQSPGRHPVLFGQRGVGKTTLVNLLESWMPDSMAHRVTCDSSDNFKAIWNRVLSRASTEFKQRAFGVRAEETTTVVSLSDLLGAETEVTPAAVADALAKVARQTIIVLDEFDQVTDPTTKAQTAALIKHVSDNNAFVTMILVGVGKSIADLIGNHPSIVRNLVQIEMPKMGSDEIKEILEAGFEKVGITAHGNVIAEAARLADGFPHYAHLLGLASSKACSLRATQVLTRELFDTLACELAIEDAIETYRSAFAVSTRTGKSGRHQHVLCACALADHDDEGMFRATDVVGVIKAYYGDELTVQKVSQVLRDLATEKRLCVLEATDGDDCKQYRFREPMMRPFLRIRAKQLGSVCG